MYAIRSYYEQADDLRFYRVVAHGTYQPQYQLLIDNRVQDGRVGYYVITPLRIGGSNTLVLVNRGWVPMGETVITSYSIHYTKLYEALQRSGLGERFTHLQGVPETELVQLIDLFVACTGQNSAFSIV